MRDSQNKYTRPTTWQIMRQRANSRHSDGPYFVCTKPVSSTPAPGPSCAPLQVEETNPQNAHEYCIPIGCSLLRFNVLSARLSESGPCHLVTLIEPSNIRLRFARLAERHDIGTEVGVIDVIFQVGTMWRL